jgi:thymidine kinase
LRTDFRGELFEGSRYLLAWADNLEEIKTICHTGRKATMVVRVDDHGRAVTEGPQVEIGGNERYVSVSRAEFKKITEGTAVSNCNSRVCRWMASTDPHRRRISRNYA